MHVNWSSLLVLSNLENGLPAFLVYSCESVGVLHGDRHENTGLLGGIDSRVLCY